MLHPFLHTRANDPSLFPLVVLFFSRPPIPPPQSSAPSPLSVPPWSLGLPPAPLPEDTRLPASALDIVWVSARFLALGGRATPRGLAICCLQRID